MKPAPLTSGLIACLLVLSVGSCDDPPAPAATQTPPASCTARVTAGDGTFSASAERRDGEAEGAVKKRATADACQARCNQREPTTVEACRARCVVDIQAAKIGARVTCRGF